MQRIIIDLFKTSINPFKPIKAYLASLRSLPIENTIFLKLFGS